MPIKGILVGVPYPLWDALRHARTLNKLPITDRFSDLRPDERTLPIQKEQWNNFSRPFRLHVETNAYSGATATDFHRVPFSAIRYYLFKRTNKKYHHQKMNATEKLINFVRAFISAEKLQQALP
jgi:hypothetical protein